MIYKDVRTMFQGIISTLEDGDVVIRADDHTQSLLGFKIDRPDRDVHSVTITSVRLRIGVPEEVEYLIGDRRRRQQMAWAMTHRHCFMNHTCELCTRLLAIHDVMES